MATTQEVSAWDEKGNPITSPAAGEAAAWDENGKPIPVSVEAPGSAQRFTEITTGAQHPIDELGRELHGIYHHPLEFGKDIAQTIGIPREFWSHPIEQFKNIGGSGIPGAVFGEHGLIKDPLGFGEHVTGANQLSEDVRSGNLKAIPGDVAGGVVNLALLKGPARELGEQVQGARAAMFPKPRRAPMGAYDEQAQSWVPGDRGEPAPVYPGASQPSVDEFYEHRGRDLMRRPDERLQPIRTSPFAGSSSSAAPQGEFALPEPRGNPTPFPKVMSRAQAEPAASSTRLQPLNKVPLEKRFDREAIADAEGLLHQESGAMLAGDRPGRYYDENDPGDYNSQKEQSAARGITSGGKWRGVSSGRDMFPFMKEHPEWGPEFIQKALRNKDSAAYQRVMEAAIDYVNRGHPVEIDPEREAIQNEEGDTSFEPERLTPIGEYKPSEKAATMGAERPNLGPEFEQGEVSHEIERNKNILRNPEATAEDRHIAETRLDQFQSGRLTPIGSKPAAIDPIKEKYPDPAVRQMVRANGEGIVEATKGNPEQLKAIHDLTRVELRQALINAGEDMGQQTVSNSKFAGEGSISRQEAFDRLLQKGHSPDDIVRLAKHIPEGTRLQPIAGPRYAYRAHDVGKPEAMDLERSHAHATMSPEEAQSYTEGRGQGRPQQVSRIDLSRLREGHDFEELSRPGKPSWIRFKTRRVRGDFE